MENFIREVEFRFHNIKIFLIKIRRQSRRKKGEDAESNILSNCHKFTWRICVSTVKNRENIIPPDDFSLHKITIYSYEKFVVRLEEKYSIEFSFKLSQNSNRKFAFQMEKKTAK